MKKSHRIALVILVALLAFAAGALVVRAQGGVYYGDLFACFSRGRAYIVEDYEECKPGEGVIGWYHAGTTIQLDSYYRGVDAGLQDQVNTLEQRVADLEAALAQAGASSEQATFDATAGHP